MAIRKAGASKLPKVVAPSKRPDANTVRMATRYARMLSAYQRPFPQNEGLRPSDTLSRSKNFMIKVDARGTTPQSKQPGPGVMGAPPTSGPNRAKSFTKTEKASSMVALPQNLVSD
jgi:hypothetical protein